MDQSAGVRRPYVDILAAFVDGKLTADQFESRFLALRRESASRGMYPTDKVEDVLDDLFYCVDAYTNLEPRKPGDLDAAGLLSAAKRALEQLKSLPDER